MIYLKQKMHTSFSTIVLLSDLRQSFVLAGAFTFRSLVPDQGPAQDFRYDRGLARQQFSCRFRPWTFSNRMRLRDSRKLGSVTLGRLGSLLSQSSFCEKVVDLAGDFRAVGRL